MQGLKDVFIVHGYYDIWLPYAYMPRNTTSVSTNVVKCSFCGHNFDVDFGMQVFENIDKVRK